MTATELPPVFRHVLMLSPEGAGRAALGRGSRQTMVMRR